MYNNLEGWWLWYQSKKEYVMVELFKKGGRTFLNAILSQINPESAALEMLEPTTDEWLRENQDLYLQQIARKEPQNQSLGRFAQMNSRQRYLALCAFEYDMDPQ